MRFAAHLVHDYILARTGSAPTMDFLKMKALGVAAHVHEDHGSLNHPAGTLRKDGANGAVGEDEG